MGLDAVAERAAEQHWVQFYETDRFLADAVVQFVSAGLGAGEPAVIFATAAHREVFAQGLTAAGFDVPALLDTKQLVMEDAAEALATFMLAGAPSWDRFFDAVGGILLRVQAAHPDRPIRAYGEMVDLLWRDGQQDAAIQLEQMWNDLRAKLEFSLLCAYVMDTFYKETGIPRICAMHSHVLSPERSPSGTHVEGHAETVQSLVAEIARRTELERALRESRSDLEDFISNAVLPIHRVDRHGIIRWANKAELAMLGYREDEYVGKPITDFHVDRQAIEEILARLGRGETLVDCEARVRAKNGEIKVLKISSNVQLKHGEFHATRCFSRDVTEEKRAHEAASAARIEAEHANRAKDEFLAILGHELRNPLSPILTAVQLMRVRGDTSSTREQNIIERQVRHLIHIVDDLLDISRVARGKIQLEKQPLKLRALVTKAVEITSPLFEERAQRLDVSLPPEDV
jgi:PAS domain S-box-containing protein